MDLIDGEGFIRFQDPIEQKNIMQFFKTDGQERYIHKKDIRFQI